MSSLKRTSSTKSVKEQKVVGQDYFIVVNKSKRYRIVMKDGQLPFLKVAKIKEYIYNTAKIPISDQMLFSGKIKLRDTQVGSEFGLSNGAELTLVRRSGSHVSDESLDALSSSDVDLMWSSVDSPVRSPQPAPGMPLHLSTLSPSAPLVALSPQSALAMPGSPGPAADVDVPSSGDDVGTRHYEQMLAEKVEAQRQAEAQRMLAAFTRLAQPDQASDAGQEAQAEAERIRLLKEAELQAKREQEAFAKAQQKAAEELVAEKRRQEQLAKTETQAKQAALEKATRLQKEREQVEFRRITQAVQQETLAAEHTATEVARKQTAQKEQVLQSKARDHLQQTSEGQKQLNAVQKREDSQHPEVSRQELAELVASENSSEGQQADLARQHSADVQRQIVDCIKRNFELEKEVRRLDGLIRLFVRNRQAFQAALAEQAATRTESAAPVSKPELKQRELFGNLFYLLQTDLSYLAALCANARSDDMESLSNVIVLGMYGDQFESREEHVLLALLLRVLRSEFERNKGGIGSFLRHETTLAKMLRLYARRTAGFAFLKEVVAPVLQKLQADTTLNLEIDPVEVYRELAATDASLQPTTDEAVALQNPVVAQRVQVAAQQLSIWCQQFVDALIFSVEKLPYGIRWMCKQLAILAKEHFKDAGPKDIGYLIGGFVILRYVNPAIVMRQPPLIEGNISPLMNRNLKLIGKVLQNLSNGILFGEKENFTVPLNPFLEANLPRLLEFFDKVCAVDDLEEHYATDRWLFYSRRNESICRVSHNDAVKMFTACCKQFAPQLLPATDSTPAAAAPAAAAVDLAVTPARPTSPSPIQRLLSDIGTPPPLVPRDQDYSLSLHLVPRDERTFAGDEPHSISVPSSPHEVVYIEQAEILDQMPSRRAQESMLAALKHIDVTRCRASVVDAIALVTEAKASAVQQERYRAAEQLKNTLELLQRIHSRAPYILDTLMSDMVAVLRRRSANRAQSGQRLAALEGVLRETQAHHAYLMRTVDAHTAYLDNVRRKVYNPERLIPKKDSKTNDTRASEFTLKVVGPFKFTLRQLLQDRVITSAGEIGDCSVMIATSSAAIFDIQFITSDKVHISVDLMKLLEQQAAGQSAVVIGPVTFNVDALVALLNRYFMK
eukprot:TRINITY_DN3432_c0_g1_i3.p1 TRINITY_DN3432_c0_g1~~TRINITY_DN3432_c0_g1_i3.p1  ORF type:complete len:1127 (+),score=257.59 TRINITY_DN3432_c0_g1_i3:133-3513(+)